MPLTQAPAPSFQSAIVLTLPLRRTITYGSKLCKIKHLHGYPFPTSYIKIFNLMQQNSMSSEKTLFLPLYLPVPQRANHTMQCPTLPLRRCTITYYGWTLCKMHLRGRGFLDTQVSLAPTQYPCQSVSPLVRWSVGNISVQQSSLMTPPPKKKIDQIFKFWPNF